MIQRPQSDVHELTDRQLEIMALVSKGCSNADIARMLDISPNTVKAHMATILERLDVCNRTEASVLYEKHLVAGAQNPGVVGNSEPIIAVRLWYQRAGECRTAADQLAQLLQGFEVFTPQSMAVDEAQSAESTPQYQLYVNTDDSAHRLLAVYSDGSGGQEQIYHASLESTQTDALKQHALSVYRSVLTHWLSHHDQKGAVAQLFRVLKWIESSSHSQHERALQLLDQLISAEPEWHLPHALKATLVYKAVATGLQADAADHVPVVAMHARQALALKSDSAWSQLAFADFCVLSSELALGQTHLRACLSLNACQYRAIQLLGQLCAFCGQSKESIEHFEHMLAYFPNTESDGLCYGALAFVHYCSGDFADSERMALRALMYANAPKVPMLLTLVSIAELQGNASALSRLKDQLHNQTINDAAIQNSLQIAAKVVPPQYLDGYLASLHRANVI